LTWADALVALHALGAGEAGATGRSGGSDTSKAFRPPASQADALRGAPRALGPGRGWRRRLQCGSRHVKVKGVPPGLLRKLFGRVTFFQREKSNLGFNCEVQRQSGKVRGAVR